MIGLPLQILIAVAVSLLIVAGAAKLADRDADRWRRENPE
jgi:hypothetical protein